MLRFCYKIALASLTVVLVGIVATVQADVIKVYDFDTNVGQTLTVGSDLIGQDNWINLATMNNLTVADGSTMFSGNFAQAGAAFGDTQAGRTNDLNWSYSIPAHTEFDVSALIFSPGYAGPIGQGGHGASVGFQPSTTIGSYTGLVFGTNASTYLRWFNNASAGAGGMVAELDISDRDHSSVAGGRPRYVG